MCNKIFFLAFFCQQGLSAEFISFFSEVVCYTRILVVCISGLPRVKLKLMLIFLVLPNKVVKDRQTTAPPKKQEISSVKWS